MKKYIIVLVLLLSASVVLAECDWSCVIPSSSSSSYDPTSVSITGGTISGTDITVGAGKTIDVSAGTITTAADQITGAQVADATLTTVGVAELATSAEAVTGTDTDRIVTPSALTSRMEAPGAIGGTTPAAGTFVTITVEDAASAIYFKDTDTTDDVVIADIKTPATGTGSGVEYADFISRIMINGSLAEWVNVDASAGTVTFPLGTLISDNITAKFGTDLDWYMDYDEADTDSFRFYTAKTASSAITNAMYVIAADTANAGMTANQQVFEIGKGGYDDNDANFTELFSVDEDGDVNLADDSTYIYAGDDYIRFTPTAMIYSGNKYTLQVSDDLLSGNMWTLQPSAVTKELTGTNNRQALMSASCEVQQSGTAAFDGLLIDVTGTSWGDGSTGDGNNLLDLKVDGVQKFEVDREGIVTFANYVRHISNNASASQVGVTAPTATTTGTTRGLGFDADGELAFFEIEIPTDWDGASDMTIEVIWSAESGDTVADTEVVIWDSEYRSIAEGEAVDNGTAVTVSATHTQSGAGTDKELYETEVTLDWDNANQPLLAGDSLFVKLNRDVTAEAGNSYSGLAILHRYEIKYMSNRLPYN